MIKKFTFTGRQELIPAWRLVLIHFSDGDVRAEYVSASEEVTPDNNWSYEFLVQSSDASAVAPTEEDLFALCNSDLVEPYVTRYEDGCNISPSVFVNLQTVDSSIPTNVLAAVANECGNTQMVLAPYNPPPDPS